MSTRSLTRVFDYERRELACIYRQADGTPDCHGESLAEILRDFEERGSLEARARALSLARFDMARVAALVASGLETEFGDTYLYPPGSIAGEVNYHVQPIAGELTLDVYVEHRSYIRVGSTRPAAYDAAAIGRERARLGLND